MKVVIFSGGNILDGFFVRKSIKDAEYIIAADHGAEKAHEFKIFPHIVVGDFDSISKKHLDFLKNKNIEIVSSKVQKDETDTELAVQTALQKGATKIAILGGTEENRLDHVLANISLTRFSQTVPIYFINGNQKNWVEKGPKEVIIEGQKNDLLSLIPLTEVVTNITTKNLIYPLLNEPLYFGKPRGISNIFSQNTVTVSFTQGFLLFTHTYVDKK